MVTKIYKLEKNFKKYRRPVSRPLTQAEQFRQYVAKRKFEIALEAHLKRQKFYRRQRFWRQYGMAIIVVVMAAYVALVMLLQRLGF